MDIKYCAEHNKKAIYQLDYTEYQKAKLSLTENTTDYFCSIECLKNAI